MKEMCTIVDNTKKHPEERQYLVCIRTKFDSGSQDSWEIIIGRTNTYEYIKENIDVIDLDHSFVLVEVLTLADRKSIYVFMKHVGKFYEDTFDIEDYVKGDWDEEDYKRMNDMSLMINNDERVTMESFMNGDVNTIELK